MKKRIRLQGILIFSAVILFFFASNKLFPHWRKESTDEIFDIIGIVLLLTGFLFRICARGYKEEASRQGFALVKDGPYALMRNPMYFGTFLIGIGVSFTLLVLWAIPLFVLIFLFIYIPQIKHEEAKLLSNFKEEYARYRKNTPAIFPNPLKLINFRKYIYLKLSWIKKELSSFAATIVLVLSIEIWEDTRVFGQMEFWKEALKLLSIVTLFSLFLWLFLKKRNRTAAGRKV